MTKQELSHHVELKKQMAADLEMFAALEVGGLAAEITDLKSRIGELEAQIARSEASILTYIAAIEDARTRTIFHLRFIRCMTWKEVAATVKGISENGVKAIYARYITRRGPARMGRPPKKQG